MSKVEEKDSATLFEELLLDMIQERVGACMTVDLQLKPLNEIQDIIAERTSSILISGNSQLIFSHLYFNPKSCKKNIQNVTSQVDLFIEDYINELNNNIAASVKSLLEHNNFEIGMSLPIQYQSYHKAISGQNDSHSSSNESEFFYTACVNETTMFYGRISFLSDILPQNLEQPTVDDEIDFLL